MKDVIMGLLCFCLITVLAIPCNAAETDVSKQEGYGTSVSSFLTETGFEWAEDLTLEEIGELLKVDIEEYKQMHDMLLEWDEELFALAEKINAIECEYVPVDEILAGKSGLADRSMVEVYKQKYVNEYARYEELKESFSKDVLKELLYEYAMIESDRLLGDLVRASGITGSFDGLKLRYPVSDWYITSEYGIRMHPIYEVEKFHSGLDLISVKDDLSIYCAGDGVVIDAGYSTGYGNYAIVNHGKCSTVYAHMDVVFAEPGERVYAGGILGVMGNTGVSTGVHLHFELRDNVSGNVVDPGDYMNFSCIAQAELESSLVNDKEVITANLGGTTQSGSSGISEIEEATLDAELESKWGFSVYGDSGELETSEEYNVDYAPVYIPGVGYEGLSKPHLLNILEQKRELENPELSSRVTTEENNELGDESDADDH